MRDLSLHLLDLTMNSIRAKATLIEIKFIESKKNDQLIMVIKDNGCGMSQKMLEQVKNPFFTTRTTRKVGLGIPLLMAMSSRCEGDVFIQSEIGVGTEVRSTIKLSHIDRPPFGEIHNTIASLIYLEPNIDFIYEHQNDELDYLFSTQLVKEVIKDLPINHQEVMNWINKELKEEDFAFTTY